MLISSSCLSPSAPVKTSNFVAKLPFICANAAELSPWVRMVHAYSSKQLMVDPLQPLAKQRISQSDELFGQSTVPPAHSSKSEQIKSPVSPGAAVG